MGRQPAIVTRGYKAAAGQTPDEVLEFQAALPGVGVVVNPNRVAGAAAAQAEHGADCVVLDDGFQHRRLARDLDIVLVDVLRGWDLHALLPAGRLREPVENVRRADVLVLTRVNQADGGTVKRIRRRLELAAPGKPILGALVEPAGLVGRDGAEQALDALGGQRVVGSVRIGNPQTFLDLLHAHAEAVTPAVLDDHHRYTAADVTRVVGLAGQVGAESVVTTRKDWVKLHALWPTDGPPLWRLDVRLQLAGDVAALDAAMQAALGKQT
jgi:tetraacyldisaccharide 4'-kinase